MPPVIAAIGEPGRLADAAHERLRQAIFAGHIAPGARLSIPALASRLGVSRSPVRDAVLRLVRDGLAVEEPHRGVAVIVLDAKRLIPVYDVRAPLEGLAARLAAASERDRDGAERYSRGVGRLADAVSSHAAAVSDGDLAAAREADLHFHRITRDMAANPQLTAFLEQIQDKIRLAMASTLVTPGPGLALADHRTIYEAIAAGDPGRAEAQAVAHVTRLRAALEAHRDSGRAAGQPGEATASDW